MQPDPRAIAKLRSGSRPADAGRRTEGDGKEVDSSAGMDLGCGPAACPQYPPDTTISGPPTPVSAPRSAQRNSNRPEQRQGPTNEIPVIG